MECATRLDLFRIGMLGMFLVCAACVAEVGAPGPGPGYYGGGYDYGYGAYPWNYGAQVDIVNGYGHGGWYGHGNPGGWHGYAHGGGGAPAARGGGGGGHAGGGGHR